MTSLATSSQADQLTITIVVDNATDTLSSIDPGIPQLPEIAYLLGGVPATGDTMVTAVSSCSITSAAHATGSPRSPPHDRATGRQPCCSTSAPTATSGSPMRNGWASTSQAIDMLFLSHWQWDHSGGFTTVVAAVATAAPTCRDATPLIVDLHPASPSRAASSSRSTSSHAPAGADARRPRSGRRRHRHPCRPARRGRSLPRQRRHPAPTSYETGLTGHHTWRGGEVTLDPAIRDERFLAAHVRGRGTTVFTACSHAGIVNVGLEARRLSPTNRSTSYSAATTSPARRRGPHRTDRARPRHARRTSDRRPRTLHRLASRGRTRECFSPTRYAPSVVGTRYLLDAAS